MKKNWIKFRHKFYRRLLGPFVRLYIKIKGGIKAEKVELLYKVYPSPGYTSEIIYLYKASGFTNTKMHLDEDEFLSGKWFSRKEVKEMMKNGEIKDGKTLIALLYLLK